MRFLAVIVLITCLNNPINSGLLGPPGPELWFIEHVELEPFDLPPDVSVALNPEGYIVIKNDSPTILYVPGISFSIILNNSDEAPIAPPPGKGLLHKAVNGLAYDWSQDYDDVTSEYHYAWTPGHHDSIWLYAFENQIRSSEGSVIDLAPLNQVDENRPENVKIPEPQKAFLPIIYGNEIIEIPIIISYTLNTKYRSLDSRIHEARAQAQFINIICFVSYAAILLVVILIVRRLIQYLRQF
jgi:hypothetical protein